jgi:hypothetical protein
VLFADVAVLWVSRLPNTDREVSRDPAHGSGDGQRDDEKQAAGYAAAVFNAPLGTPLTIEVLRGVFALRVLSAR